MCEMPEAGEQKVKVLVPEGLVSLARSGGMGPGQQENVERTEDLEVSERGELGAKRTPGP